MTQSAQPPEETFCLTCGPDAALERHGGAVLHCPRCGDRQPVPDFPLFVVTGASGTGKTTITGPLRRALPGCDVFDTDIILQVAALGWDTWRNTWLRLAHAIALNGRVTVLCGSLLPSQLETLPARKLIGPIRFCTLDCPDTVLAGRLCRRPSWRGTSTEEAIARHQRFAAWLRAHIQPCHDTSQLTPDETAERIATWIRLTVTAPPAGPRSPAGGVMPENLIAQHAGRKRRRCRCRRRAESMTADQSPKQAGKAQAALTRTVRAVTQPGGKDVDWGKVGAVGSIVGAVAVIHGLKTRSWRYLHTAAVALAIGAAVAGRLKAKYAGASQEPEN